MTLESQLGSGLEALALELAAPAQTTLLRYLDLLQRWNRVYNLTAIRDPSRLVSHHLLDCLAVAPHLGGPRIVDVGSGAGLPGIPLAVAREDWQVTLLESNHKKGAFLRQAVAELRLSNVAVVTHRAEDWRPEALFDVVVSRAFSDLAGFAEAAVHLCAPPGVLAAMKGVYPDEELGHLPAAVALERVLRLEVPGLRSARHLVLLRRATR